MIEIQQRNLWRPEGHPDGAQRGDCVRACVASIFEVAYEDVEIRDGGYTEDVRKWVRDRYPGVDVVHRLLVPMPDRPERLEDLDDWPTHAYHSGYWIAGIKSPRIPAHETFGCGCAERVPGGDPNCQWCAGEPEKRSMGIEWGIHAVVMRHGAIVWDPYPESEDRDPDEPVRFHSQTTFVLADPAELATAMRSQTLGAVVSSAA